MENYNQVAFAASKRMTTQFSSSFSLATAFFPKRWRQDIYNVYGLVRLADEIVDTYRGKDALVLLDELEQATYQGLKDGYSPNLIVHAFALTAQKYQITKELVEPFYASMRTDVSPPSRFSRKQYQQYIYGSAEVVGLMCLRVFCEGNDKQYSQLKDGACALGSAFQKVNFLRDLAADYEELGRFYFPEGSYQAFGDDAKQKVVADIMADFAAAQPAVNKLPKGARKPVLTAYTCYRKLLDKLAAAPAEQIKNQRMRLGDPYKVGVLLLTVGGLNAKA